MRDYIKKNKVLKTIVCFFLTIYYNYVTKWYNLLMAYLRKVNIVSGNRYGKLKSLHNKFIGKRCFIIANGPSLKLSDCEMLKAEYTFGMNAIIDLFDKTDWRPTFYGVQDITVYKNVKSRLSNSQIDNLFIADFLNSDLDNIIEFPLNFLGHRVNYFNEKYKTKFSDNAFACVYDGYSITYSLIQIAYYLGFREIYLIGCDCSFLNNLKNSHFEGCKTFGYDSDLSTAAERNLCGYMAAKEFFKNNEGKIINCTRGGALEVFERMNLEDVVKS